MKSPIDHVDLRVNDLSAAAAFYRNLLPVLGFTEEESIEGWIQFAACDDGNILTFFGITEDPAHQGNRNRIAFAAPSPNHVNEVALELVKLGAASIEGPGFEADGYYAVFFSDHWGNRFEVCHRAPTMRK